MSPDTAAPPSEAATPPRADRITIVGPSASGKTTLLQALVTLGLRRAEVWMHCPGSFYTEVVRVDGEGNVRTMPVPAPPPTLPDPATCRHVLVAVLREDDHDVPASYGPFEGARYDVACDSPVQMGAVAGGFYSVHVAQQIMRALLERT